MSQTTVLAPIVAALVRAEDILGKNRKWQASNATQTRFLKEALVIRDQLHHFSEKELRSWADWVAANLNKILKDEGFDIQLEDFGSNKFGVVSILDVTVEWLVKGQKIELKYQRKKYPAVKLPSGWDEKANKLNFETCQSSEYQYPVALVHTKSGDQVYMTIADKKLEGFALKSQIDEVRGQLALARSDFESLQFPMIDLNQQVDIGWLVGMKTTDNKQEDWEISQAKQQTKFKMNEVGARVKSAVALVARTTSVRLVSPHLIIDQPFYLWIERSRVDAPVLYAYLDTEDWKDPGNLEM